VYETGSPLLFAYISHLLILPLSFFLGVGVPSLSFAGFMLKAVRRGSFVILMVRCCFGGLCARDGLANTCLVFAGVALRLLPLSLFLGVRAPSLSLGRFLDSKLLHVTHCSFSHQLLCFVFIGANSNSMNSIRRAASLAPQVVVALLMLPSQALLLLCHLDNDLVIIILYIR